MDFWKTYQRMCAAYDRAGELTLGQTQAYFQGDASAVAPEAGAALAEWAQALDALANAVETRCAARYACAPFQGMSPRELQTLLCVPEEEIARVEDACRRAAAQHSAQEIREGRALQTLREQEHRLYALIDRPPFITRDLEGFISWKSLFSALIFTLALRRLLDSWGVVWRSPQTAILAENEVSARVIALRVCNRRAAAGEC